MAAKRGARNRSQSVKTGIKSGSTGNSISIDGLDEIRELLKDVGLREGRNLMRATVRSIATRIQKSAKSKAPSDSGDLKTSIKVRQRKSTPDKPIFDVVIGTTNGAKLDAFYWRFIEYGTGASIKHGSVRPARPFIRPAVEEVKAQLPGILRDEFGKKWEKALARKRKKAAQIPGE